MKRIFFLMLLTGMLSACGGGESAPEGADVKISTDMGDIYIELYDDTPKHKENFLKLAKDGYYDNTTFHRVMKEFMIQGGDPNTKDNSGPAGQGGPGYTIPAEFVDTHYHVRGELAAARQPDQVNPKRESSGSQFYIVHGRKWSEQELGMVEQQVTNGILQARVGEFNALPENAFLAEIDFEKLQAEDPDSMDRLNAMMEERFSKWRTENGIEDFHYDDATRKQYMDVGGAPFLDRQYTVFGRVVQGMEVVDSIAGVQTGANDLPVKDIKMTVTVLGGE